ncbi:MAG TPA: ATP-binding protein [Anaerolineales bacterium]|nr:ATP-binding protein [Anaerolineales bacterium]
MPKTSESKGGLFLRPRARLLRALGEELISSEIAAILELVKNSYDADATIVVISFHGSLLKGGGPVQILDNGNGMTAELMQRVWLEPATPSKRGAERRSENFHRRFLGAKGVGRFASARLAETLDVVSRRRGEKGEAIAHFDWNLFDDESRYLDEIPVSCSEREISEEFISGGALQDLIPDKIKSMRPIVHGTLLRMECHKHDWPIEKLDELRICLSRLTTPDSSTKGFRIFLNIEGHPELSDIIDPPDILLHPHYTISANVHADGTCRGVCEIRAEGAKIEFHERLVRIRRNEAYGPIQFDQGKDEEVEKRNPTCGPIKLELRAWDRDNLENVVQATDSTTKRVKEDLDRFAGISIYRDNFRVLPYGEPNDDWCRLDLRRVQAPTRCFSQNQVFGAIHISADTNPDLKDMTNRIGMEETPALEDLRGVIAALLSKLEIERFRVRERRDPKERPKGGLFSGFELDNLREHLKQKHPEDKATQKLISATVSSQQERLREVQTAMARYQRLATLGTLIDHLLHEGRKPLARIRGQVDDSLALIRACPPPHHKPIPEIEVALTEIAKQGDTLHTAFKRVEPFGGRKRGRPQTLYIEAIIKDAFEIFTNEIKRSKVKCALPEGQTLVRVDRAEMAEVIIILLDNALYWLQQKSIQRRQIKVAVSRPKPGTLEIVFADSGPGIPNENRQLIFHPYFTTKPEGVGLGLSIAGEIVEDYYNGQLELMKSGPLSGACFKIILNKRV